MVYFGIYLQLRVKLWRHSQYLQVVASEGWNGANDNLSHLPVLYI